MPTLIDRARLALTVFSRGMPMGRIMETKQAKSPYIWPVWKNDQPQWILSDFDSYVRDGFDRNSIIYSAVMYKARAMAVAPLRAYGGDPEQPELLPPAHPLAQLVARPNTAMSWTEFQMLNEVYLNIAGEVFVYLARPRGGGLPEALYTLRPDRVYLIPQKGKVIGWLYVPEGQPFDAGLPMLSQDVMTVKFPNPLDPYEGLGRGLSPLAPLAQSADIDNKVTEYLKVFFNNSAVPQGILKFNLPLDDTEMARIRARWKEIYGGVENWGEVGVLDNSGEYQRLGMNFAEMNFDYLDQRNEVRIAGPLGVPVTLLGTRSGLSAATYNNKQSDRRMFWEDTMVPELKLYEDEYRYFLQGGDDTFVAFDLAGVPALQQDKPLLITAAAQLFGMGMPANMALQTVGLQAEPIPGGDVGYLPLSLIQVGQPKPTPVLPGAPVPPPEQIEEPAPLEDDNAEAPEAEEQGETPKTGPGPAEVKAELSPQQKAAFWQQIDGTARSWEPKFEAAAEQAFEADRRALQAGLSAGKKKALTQKATINWSTVEADWMDYIGAAGAENWRTTFRPAIQGVIEAEAKRFGTMIGVEFDVRNLLAEAWFSEYMLTFSQPINRTTSDALSTMLQQARKDGWGIDTMSNHLDTLFRQWSSGDVPPEEFAWYEDRLPQYRRQNIARTESMRSIAASDQAMFSNFNVQKKEWLATQDSRTRDTHAEANGQVVGIDEPFMVAGYPMMYPLDMSMGAPIEEAAQCRCVMLPYLGDEGNNP